MSLIYGPCDECHQWVAGLARCECCKKITLCKGCRDDHYFKGCDWRRRAGMSPTKAESAHE